MQAGEITVLERPRESDAGGMLAARLDAERAQFARQQVRGVQRAGGEELEGRRGAIGSFNASVPAVEHDELAAVRRARGARPMIR